MERQGARYSIVLHVGTRAGIKGRLSTPRHVSILNNLFFKRKLRSTDTLKGSLALGVVIVPSVHTGMDTLPSQRQRQCIFFPEPSEQNRVGNHLLEKRGKQRNRIIAALHHLEAPKQRATCALEAKMGKPLRLEAPTEAEESLQDVAAKGIFHIYQVPPR